MSLAVAKYDDDEAYYAVNLADREAALNSTEGLPEITKELRQATKEILLRQARKAGQCAVKVAVGASPVVARVKGYATFFSYIEGCTLAELEHRLGFRPGVLQQHGAYIYHVDGLALNSENIAPRGYTDWAAGITPRDLYNLSKQSDVAVANHRNYPSSTKPIPQFVILKEVPYVGEPKFISADRGGLT